MVTSGPVSQQILHYSAMPSRSSSVHPPSRSGSLHVVLVEDDAELRDVIFAPALIAAGYKVTGVGSAAEFYRLLVVGAPDIVVLDILLPDESGFEIARHLREHSDVGIIMLTSLATAADRIRGLHGGADDYLTKPVETDLLCATVRSLARRLRPLPVEPFRQWRLDADGWRLADPQGKTMSLNAVERCVLHRLFSTPSVTVRRETLIADLTDDTHVFDPHRLDMMMHRLRRRVLDNGMMPLPLRTVRGTGYALGVDGSFT